MHNNLFAGITTSNMLQYHPPIAEKTKNVTQNLLTGTGKINKC